MNAKFQASLDSLSPSYPALMTHVVLGFPSLDESLAIVRVMAAAGAGFIELQIPFSDPMADGPTIMHANEVALAQGVSPELCLEAVKTLSNEVDTPLLLMSYCNILFTYKGAGLAQFCKEAAAAGAVGLIVPDVPLEENREGYWSTTREFGLTPISLVSPVTPPARMKRICDQAEGFIYCVATTGTTGARSNIPETLPQYLKQVRTHTTLPLAVGFGISSAAHVAALAGLADIAIVGSAMIDCINSQTPENRLRAVEQLTEELRRTQ